MNKSISNNKFLRDFEINNSKKNNNLKLYTKYRLLKFFLLKKNNDELERLE